MPSSVPFGSTARQINFATAGMTSPGRSTPPPPVPPITPATIGLSKVAQCASASNVADTIAPFIVEKFSLDEDAAIKLGTQLTFFLEKVGVVNESVLSMMKEKTSWPIPSTMETTSEKLEMITVPVVLLLSEIAGCTEQVLESNYYLAPGVTYKSLFKWTKAMSDPGRYDARGSHSSTTPGSSTSATGAGKMPHFKVDPFSGDALSGDDYVKDVISIFKSNAVPQYLSDATYCSINTSWSGAFASRLRKSVADSSTMGFLATTLEKQDNCAICWSQIQDHLTTSELKVGRVLRLWQDFFKLRCDDKGQFLAFYSSATQIIHKLQAVSSIAIGDDTFLRSFFAKAIDAEELKDEAKLFLKDMTKDPIAILQLVHSDFRAQDTRDQLRDDDIGKSKSILRRAEAKPKPAVKEWRTAKFPANSNNAIPPEIYKQVQQWYYRAAVTEEKRTSEEKTFLKSFVFKRSEAKKEDPPKKKWEDRKPYKKKDYQSRRSRTSRSRSASYEDRDRHRHSRRGRNDDHGDGNRRHFREDSRSPDRDRNAGQDRRGGNGNGSRAGRRAFMFNG